MNKFLTLLTILIIIGVWVLPEPSAEPIELEWTCVAQEYKHRARVEQIELCKSGDSLRVTDTGYLPDSIQTIIVNNLMEQL